MHTRTGFIRAALAALMLCTTVKASAQEAAGQTSPGNHAFGVGDKTLAIGLGLGLTYDYITGTSAWPSLVAVYDQGIKDGVGPGVIGIGGIVGYKSAHYDYDAGGYDARWTNVIVAARATYHLSLGDGLEKLDPYGGVMMGLRFSRYRNDFLSLSGFDYDYTHVRLASGLFVGARYHFTEALGAWAELGYDVAFIKFGVHFNF